jgi:hypothetical protein
MKNTMKTFAAIIIMFAFSIGAMAQSTDNANILGKAEVLQGINVEGVEALDFGRVSPGLAKSIDLENTPSGGQMGEGNEKTGVFTVSASSGTNVTIQFTTLPSDLTNGSNTLPIGSYIAGYGNTLAYTGIGFDPLASTIVSGGNFPANTIGSVNAIYVHIGGTVTPGATQAIGNYSSTITLTATYN